MELTTKQLLQDLSLLTKKNLNSVKYFEKETIESLNWKKDSESWSVLECIEHLNKYGDFYIPEIKKRIKSSNYKSSKVFKSNWLGKYFSKSVSYSENLNKMKTFKSMNPLHSKLNNQTLKKFIRQQEEIIYLLEEAKEVNLDKTKTAISISKIIKLKLGDTFRVIIYHNERHVKQAEKVLHQLSLKNKRVAD